MLPPFSNDLLILIIRSSAFDLIVFLYLAVRTLSFDIRTDRFMQFFNL